MVKISIITIVLNDVTHIERTILSVINQKFPNLEYLIIDGGSTDGTVEIIKKYKTSISYWDSQKDNGIVDAFNKGILQSTGEVIGLVNSGDFLEANALENVSRIFHHTQTDIVYGNMQYWNKKKKDYIYNANHILLTKFMSLNHPAIFVKKELYEKHGLFSDSYTVAMDYEIMLRFFSKGAKFMYIDTVLSNMSLGGVSDINWQLAYHEAYTIRKKYLGNSLTLYISYFWQVSKRHTSNILSKLGLKGIIRFYRRYVSTIKKRSHENIN